MDPEKLGARKTGEIGTSYRLHSIVIELAAEDFGRVPQTLGRSLHAAVLKWLNMSNPRLAEAVHNSQNSPFSISPLLGGRRRGETRVGDEFMIRVSLLDGSLLSPLLRGLEKWGNSPLVLAKFPFTIIGVHHQPGSKSSVVVSEYQILAAQGGYDQDITLEFSSPTSFKQNQAIQPFPLPELVFGSLHRRWNTFAPDDLKFAEVQWQGLTSAFSLTTHAFRMKGGAEIGCQGWVKYRFMEPEQARMAAVLAHFAFFAGVGRKTAMGMGQTQILWDRK